jgi:hypothetical protein
MKQKRRMSEAAIEKKRERDRNKMNNFIQRKEAEKLASGMLARNSALEEVGCKLEEEEIVTVSAKAAGDEAATWAAKCAEQKQKHPSCTLYHSVSVALQAPPVVKIRQEEAQQLELEEHARVAAIMKSRNSEEKADEMAEFTKQRDAGRARRAKAIFAKSKQQ